MPVIVEESYANEKEYDILFLGSSHAWHGVDIPLFTQLTNLDGAVFFVEGADPRNSYFLLKEAIKTGGAPDYVVLDSYVLYDPDHKQYRTATPYIHGLAFFNRLLFLKDNLQSRDLDETLKNSNILFRNHALWKNREYIGKNIEAYIDRQQARVDPEKANEIYTEYSEGFYQDLSRIEVAPLVKFDQSYNIEPDEWSAYSEYQLLRLLALCRKHGIQLIIVDIPALNTSGVDIDALNRFCADNGIPFYDHGSLFRATHDGRNLHFLEGGVNSHLNYNGRKLYTINYVAPLLAKITGTAVNDMEMKNQTRLIQSDLLIQGLDEPARDTISFTLLPFWKSIPLEYEWILYKGKQPYLQQAGADRSFTIPKACWGTTEYVLEVMVMEPDAEDGGLKFRIPLS
jgi:hypothetical protein